MENEKQTEQKYLNYAEAVATAVEAKACNKFWKPERGNYKVKFLGEARLVEITDRQTGEVSAKIFVDIETQDGQQWNWSMGKGKTPAAASVQVAAVGAKNGKLAGVQCNVIIKMSAGKDGKMKRDYTVVEAQDFLSAAEEAVKEKAQKKEDAKAFV